VNGSIKQNIIILKGKSNGLQTNYSPIRENNGGKSSVVVLVVTVKMAL